MVRALLVRSREHVEQSRVPVEDDRLSIRTATPEATATAVLVESPDAVLVPVDEVDLDEISRINAAVGPTPIVALAADRDHSVLREAIAAGATDALSWDRTAGTELADRLVYTLQRRHRQHQSACNDPAEGGPPWADRQQPNTDQQGQWTPSDTESDEPPAPSAADPALMLEADSRILRAREPFERLIDRSVNAPGALTLEQFLPAAENVADEADAVLDPDRRQLDWEHLDLPVVRPDGTETRLTGSTVPAPEVSPTADSPLAVFLDVEPTETVDTPSTEIRSDAPGDTRSGSVEHERRDESVFKQLLETTQSLMIADTPDAVASSVADATTQLLSCEGAVVRFHEDGALRATATSGTLRTDGCQPTPLSVGKGAAGQAFEHGETVHSGEFSQSRGDEHGRPSETCYGGNQAVLAVPIEQYGTLDVVAPCADLKDEQHLAELLAATAATALDRTDRAQRIRKLLAKTQSLLDANTPQVVCERTLEAVRSLVGDEAIAVYLLQENDRELDPVVWSERTEQLVGELPSIQRDQEKVWEAFESGELQCYDNVTENTPGADDTGVRSEIHVPLGEHGVLFVGSPEPDLYGDVDEQLMQLLGVNVTRTLDRVQRQQELREYEAAFETVGHMVVLCDDGGEITHATEPLAEEIGEARTDLVGSCILEHFEPEDRGEIRSALRRAADAGTVTDGADAVALGDADMETIDTRLCPTTEESIPVTLEFDSLPGLGRRTVLTVHDRSELVEKQSQLARERDRFSYLFDHLPDAVVEVELDDTGPLVTNVNSAFSDIFGFDPDRVTGSSLNDIIVPEEEREAARQLDNRALNGRINTKEVERMTDTGRRQFLFRGIPYELDGQETTCGFGIYTDITEQKERQQHLQVIHRVLRHNLRNDINVVLGGLDVLEPAVEGRKAEFLEDLRSTAEGLVDMSHKAKELAAAIDLDTDDCDPINAERLVDSAVEIARDKYDDVSFETDTAGHVVQGNPDVLSSAILELVENAVEHGDADRIRIDVTADTDGVRLRVADDGPGIPEYERDVVAGGTITPLQHGSGLGLWLVRRAAKSCGGAVSFDENGPLSGGTVAIELHRTTPESDHDPSGERGAQTS
jgi:PAS domain S-box-containing protein